MSGMKKGDTILILIFHIQYTWYCELSGGKLHCDWRSEFNEDVFFDNFQDGDYADAPTSIEIKSKKTTTISKNDSESDKKIQVKLSEFPEYSGKSGV